MVTIRELVPTRRYQRPIWELLDESGALVGYVRQHSIRSTSVLFYKAVGVHPVTGQHVTLESSADREERIRTIMRFREDPEIFRGVHWHPRE